MKALTFHGKEKIEYETVGDPRIESSGDVIVKVELSAICGSDLHVYHEREKGLDHGAVMGHEFTGEIVEAGDGVKSFGVGDTVISPFTTNCGECFYCRIGLTCRCANGQLFGWVKDGAGLQGAQAEYVRVPMADSTLLARPETVTAVEALLLGDIFSTAYFCADMAGIEPGGVYAVIGCGPVGLLAILSARELGAEEIYAVDSIGYRLELARRFGAIPVDYSEEDPLDVLREATDGRGADAALEAVGSTRAGRTSLEIVRPGGTVSVVGVHTDEHFAFSPVEAYDKNITYRVGRCPARYYMERLVPLVQKRKYDISAVISHRMPLRGGVEGYRIFDMKLEDCVKVVLTV